MPGFFHEPMSRKQFLATASVAAGAFSLSSAARTLLAADQSAGLRVALLSDTHIPADPTNAYRGFRPVDNLKQVVTQVVAAKPAMAIVSGDAARLEGQVDDYRALKKLLAPVAAQAPVYIGLGNHDDRRNFFKVFDVAKDANYRKLPVGGKHVTVIEADGSRFIVLDSLLYANKVAGLLGKAQRTWLAGYLKECDERPTSLFVHHTLGDGDGDLLDVDRLYRILTPYRKVKALFYGHSHRYAFDRHEHIQLINLPAVGYNFADSQPVGWVEGRFSAQGVDLTLHAIGGGQGGDGKMKRIDWA